MDIAHASAETQSRRGTAVYGNEAKEKRSVFFSVSIFFLSLFSFSAPPLFVHLLTQALCILVALHEVARKLPMVDEQILVPAKRSRLID